MKKIISMFMAVVMMLTLIPVTAFAETSAESKSFITAKANTTEADIGDTLEVTFTLADNPGFTNIEMQLAFDSAVLQFTGLKVNEDTEAYEGRFGGGATEANTIVDNEKYGYIAHARSATSTSDGVLFVAQFTVIGAGNTDVSANLVAFQVTKDDGSITDYKESVDIVASDKITISGVPATAVTLDTEELSLEEGEKHLLAATVEPDNSTDKVKWTSSDETVAMVSDIGIVTAVAKGTATVTATAGDVCATCEVTVTKEVTIVTKDGEDAVITGIKSMSIGGDMKTLKNIYKLELAGHEAFTMGCSMNKAVSYKLDGTSFMGDPWGVLTSSLSVNTEYAGIITKNLLVSYADLVASVGENNKNKLGVNKDDTLAFMYVKSQDYNYGILFVIGEAPAATDISINDTLEVGVGSSETLRVSFTPSGAEENVTWTSSDESIAIVDEDGKITGLKNGTVTITASTGTLSDTCEVTVVTKIENIPSNGGYSGSVQGITIGGLVVQDYSWSDKTLNVYVDESTNGTAWIRFNWFHSYNQGTTTTAEVEVVNGVATYDGFTQYANWVINFAVREPATDISLDKKEMEIRIGDSETLTATVAPEDSTDSIKWTSSDTSIAKVNKNGKVTAVAEGSVNITATAGDCSAVCQVNVYAVHPTAVRITNDNIVDGKIRLRLGDSTRFIAVIEPENCTDKAVWSTSDENIVNVYNGSVYTNAAGTATVTLTVGEMSVDVEVEVYTIPATSITLDSSELKMNVGDSIALSTTVEPENHTDGDIVWTSSDTKVVTVDEEGNVKAVAGGTATITATLGSLSVECNVVVAEPYVITENLPTLPDTGWCDIPVINSIYITGADVLEMTWDDYEENATELVCNVKLAGNPADGTMVKAIAYVDGYYMSNRAFSGSTSLADGQGTVTVVLSNWNMVTTNLVFNFEVKKYSVSISDDIENGIITADKAEAAEGETVTLDVIPVEGYGLAELKVFDASENKIEVTDNTFIMPASDVKVEASFKTIETLLSEALVRIEALEKEAAEALEKAEAAEKTAEAAQKEAAEALEKAEAAEKAAEEAQKAAEEAKKAAEAEKTEAEAAKKAAEEAQAKAEKAQKEAEAAKKAAEEAQAKAEEAQKEAAVEKAAAEAAKTAAEEAAAKAEAAQKAIEEATAKPAATKITSIKKAKKKLTIKWKKVSGASGYVIYRSTKKNGTYKKVKTIKKATTVKWTNKKLKSNKRYYYKVRAYKIVNGKKVYSKYSAVKSAKTK